MNDRLKPLLAVCSMLWVGASIASAQTVIYQFELTGDQETPPVATPGWGFATVTLNTDTLFLTWDVSYQDLTSGVTAAHFHGPAAPGESTGFFVNMFPATGATSGTMEGSATLDATEAQWVLDGLSYINIHTSSFPPGEIRGQVVPEPGTYALILGLAALAGAWFWRRKRGAL